MPTIALLAYAGQSGIAWHPDQDGLPPGWRNDVLRHEAIWDRVLHPGAALIEGLAPVGRGLSSRWPRQHRTIRHECRFHAAGTT